MSEAAKILQVTEQDSNSEIIELLTNLEAHYTKRMKSVGFDISDTFPSSVYFLESQLVLPLYSKDDAPSKKERWNLLKKYVKEIAKMYRPPLESKITNFSLTSVPNCKIQVTLMRLNNEEWFNLYLHSIGILEIKFEIYDSIEIYVQPTIWNINNYLKTMINQKNFVEKKFFENYRDNLKVAIEYTVKAFRLVTP